MKIVKIIAVAFSILISSSAFCEETNDLKFRPHLGIGNIYFPGSGGDETISHFGGRVLLSAGGIRWYGLEMTRFLSQSGESFVSSGVILEQRLFRWFNMSIGTIGYFSYGQSRENPIGITTNLGWEPSTNAIAHPFVTYKGDFIFVIGKTTVHSLSVGLSW